MDVIIALMGLGLCGFLTKIGYDSTRQGIAYGELLPSGYDSQTDAPVRRSRERTYGVRSKQ